MGVNYQYNRHTVKFVMPNGEVSSLTLTYARLMTIAHLKRVMLVTLRLAHPEWESEDSKAEILSHSFGVTGSQVVSVY